MRVDVQHHGRGRLLAAGPASGGVGDFFEHAVDALRDAGWSITTLRPEERGSPFLAAARLAIRHRRALRGSDAVHCEFGSNDLGVFWFAVLASLVRRDCVLVAHDVPKLALAPGAALIARSSRLRTVVAHRLLSPMLDPLIRRYVRRRAGAWVVFGSAARDLWRNRVRGRVSVARHGALRTSGDGCPPSRGEHVLFAGFLGPSKGLDTLIDCWRRVGSRTSLPLKIAGDTPAAFATLVEALREQGDRLPNRPQWLGAVADEDDFQRLFARAALVVLPYRQSSAASGILVRAMVEGRCVVATRVPAMVDAITPERNGVLVEPDDAQALCDAVERLLRSPGERDQLGAAAAAAARELFSWRGYVEGVEAAYSSACER